ncbi:hypothetical protein [Cupriavidus plantarum]|uniref:hypothetical protein n=1 Tax=Cupriavidus plantarum TaxID=942865 RepID=UPI00339D3900
MRFLSELPWDGLLVALGALRVKAPDVYSGIVLDRQSGMQGLIQFLESRIGRWSRGSVTDYLNVLLALMRVAAGQPPSPEYEIVRSQRQLLFGADGTADLDYPTALVLRAARSLDLDIASRGF